MYTYVCLCVCACLPFRCTYTNLMQANVGERTGRELYAPAFFAAVDAGVGSVMCAFNRVNNTYNCESPDAFSLLKDPTAGGFRGWVVRLKHCTC